jgi:hypothetical protein
MPATSVRLAMAHRPWSRVTGQDIDQWRPKDLVLASDRPRGCADFRLSSHLGSLRICLDYYCHQASLELQDRFSQTTFGALRSKDPVLGVHGGNDNFVSRD